MTYSASVYGVKYFLRGRQVADTHEPPYKFTEVFLNKLTDGLAHPGWSNSDNCELTHNCDDGCGIECCIVMGRPYTNSVMDAVTWLVVINAPKAYLGLNNNNLVREEWEWFSY